MRTGPWHIALSIALTACSRDAGVVVHASDEFLDRALAEVSSGLLPIHVAVDGPIHAFVAPFAEESHVGEAVWTRGCHRLAWAVHGDLILHEIGHTLGLHHVDEPGNLMYSAGGSSLTPEQYEDAYQEAGMLDRCR